MAGLILVGILLLSTIEDTFNDIWGAPLRRSWFTRLVQYWTTISLGPIVVFVIIAQIGSTFSPAARNLGGFSFFSPLLFLFGFISLAFALLVTLAAVLQCPSGLGARVFQPWAGSRVVVEAAGANDVTYAPGRPVKNITCHDILQIMRVGGGQELETCRDCSRPVVNAEFHKIQ